MQGFLPTIVNNEAAISRILDESIFALSHCVFECWLLLSLEGLRKIVIIITPKNGIRVTSLSTIDY